MKIMSLHKVFISEIYISLVKSEPILTWVLSKPEFEFYSGLNFLKSHLWLLELFVIIVSMKLELFVIIVSMKL